MRERTSNGIRVSRSRTDSAQRQRPPARYFQYAPFKRPLPPHHIVTNKTKHFYLLYTTHTHTGRGRTTYNSPSPTKGWRLEGTDKDVDKITVRDLTAAITRLHTKQPSCIEAWEARRRDFHPMTMTNMLLHTKPPPGQEDKQPHPSARFPLTTPLDGNSEKIYGRTANAKRCRLVL